MLMPTARFRWTMLSCLFVTIGFMVTEVRAQTPGEESSASDGSLCELKIEGEDILTLVLLQRDAGLMRRISYPGESLELPAGEYVLYEVVLTNGYEADLARDLEPAFELTPDEPYVLKAGGPLHPSAEVKRSGAHIIIEYMVVDETGRKYEIGRLVENDYNRKSPPGFVVYDSNGNDLGGSQLDYG